MTSENPLEFQDNSEYVMDKILGEIDTRPHDVVLPKLEALYRINQKDVNVLTALAHIYYHQKDYAKAFFYVLNALDICPNNIRALKYKAWIYNERGNEEQYTKTLLQIFNSGKADWEVHDQLAVCFEENGDFLQALGLFTNALKDPNNLQPFHAALGGANCYSKAGAFEIADEIYDTLLNVWPDDLLTIYNKATNYLAKGEKDKSQALLQEIIRKDPTFQMAIELLSKLENEDFPKDWAKNMRNEHASDTETIKVRSIEELYQEYFDLMRTGNLFVARERLKAILQIDNSLDIIWSNLAGLHFMLLEIPESLDCCEKALSLTPNTQTKDISIILAKKAHALFALGKLDESLLIVDQVITREPDNYLMPVLRARILNRKKDYAGAINTLLPIVKSLDGKDDLAGLAKYLLASAYKYSGNDSKAMELLIESVSCGCEFGTRWYSVLNCQG